jgi:hypothetical protein
LIGDGAAIGGTNSIILPNCGKIVKMKAAATPGSIVAGSMLVLDGTTLGAVKLDPGTGARVTVGHAQESAAAGELFEATFELPVVISGT